MLGEQYHLLYAERYGIPTCCLRISNPYGPAQDRPDQAFGVVGTFLARASRGDDIIVFGGGTQRRDYVYVDDLTDLMVLAVTHPAAPGEVFNAGGPTVTTVREMAETVVRVVGRGRVIDAPWPDADAAVETGDYYGDLRRVRDVLGWAPETELYEGLAATWAALTPVAL
jgi:UDP-glucose 4-epimerase